MPVQVVLLILVWQHDVALNSPVITAYQARSPLLFRTDSLFWNAVAQEQVLPTYALWLSNCAVLTVSLHQEIQTLLGQSKSK